MDVIFPCEIIENILINCSYQDVINVGGVNHYFHNFSLDWSFWAAKCFRDFEYPQQNFQDYTPDPRLRYRFISRCMGDPNHGMFQAASLGDLDLCLIAIYRKGGLTERHTDCLDYPEEHLAIITPLDVAVRNQSYDVLNAVITNWDIITSSGFFKYVRRAIKTATCLGDPTSFILLLNTYIEIYKEECRDDKERQYIENALFSAGFRGHKEFIEFFTCSCSRCDGELEYRGERLSYALRGAAKSGNIKMVQWLIEQGSERLYWAFIEAARSGHLDVMKLVLKHRNMMIDTLNESLDRAAVYNQFEVVKYLLSLGAVMVTPVLENLTVMARNSNSEVFMYLEMLESIYGDNEFIAGYLQEINIGIIDEDEEDHDDYPDTDTDESEVLFEEDDDDEGDDVEVEGEMEEDEVVFELDDE